MFKNPYFYYERGCLWWTLEIGALVFAVLDVIINARSARLRSWLILLGGAIDLVIYFISRWIERNKYYREDSFWLRKDDPEDKNSQDEPKPS